MKKAEVQKNSRLPHEPYLKHFVNELHQEIPLWAFVDLLTMADISFLYKISPRETKEAVTQSLQVGKRIDILEDFLHKLTIIRNLCAHGERLYNRLFQQKPWLNKSELALLGRLPDGACDNNHLYGFIIIMKRLLTSEEFADMKTDITKLTRKYPFVNMKYYGFRNDWQTAL